MVEVLNNLKNNWARFVTTHDTHLDIPAQIASSWERCWPHISAYSWINLQKLTNDDLLSAQVLYFDLISVARPIMEDILQFTEGSETGILLVNHTGYVLDILGEPKILSHLNRLGISRGALLSEMEMGTNAFALAITERVPVQVQGYQHYRQQFHTVSEAAAPIFDVTGKPLGALGIVNFEGDVTAHTLALAVSGSRAIEGQRQADQLLGEQNNQLARLNAILNTISEAILVWDRAGTLIQANPAAQELLKLSGGAPKARQQSNENFRIPQFITNAVEQGRELTDVEANLVIAGHPVDYIVSVRFVRDIEGIQAIVAILRTAKDVRQLMQRQIGTQALYTLQDLVGTSSEIQRIHRQVTVAAAARASVMIRGELGTGKNLLSQIIHRHSSYSQGPFIVFSSTSIPGEMVVRELIGWANGSSFADDSRPGKFELADGGTLYFQDVDALPLDAQNILLNVLELGIVSRMNSSRAIPVDVRVIASSSMDLEGLIERGSFRPDLYYRLSSFEIRLPPLRERIEDLPLLAVNILRRLPSANNESPVISQEALKIMSNYQWPGNLRELEAVLGRAASQLVGSEALGPEHLPDVVRHPYRFRFESSQLVSGTTLDEIEREALLQSVRTCKGNVSKMMGMLGVSRTTLWRKLKLYKINIRDYRSLR